MATILSKDLKVKNGQVIKVQNENRKAFSNEAKSYYALWVKGENNEYCIMFTKKEFDTCEKAVGSFCEDFDLGKIYNYTFVKRQKNAKKFLIKIKCVNEDETVLVLSEKLLQTAIFRRK